ncbi:aldo/keto reductase [Natrarchaeobius halalkaliphilus]|uniref:Aldo/keto reductase n=1 Tax=Natrarchaeobius halalkaliphilus TaxID=1679091 RepID=A0A3N6M247_9EURY|nr:aldo/keto reductase [Natrarchaeobius halalkaliphilus]RQG89870.1 aldo/keto reductase [Natrarchaeobius halalkaliphilus]
MVPGVDDADAISPEHCPTTNGIPMLGLGTYRNTDPDQCTESVRTALEVGYRHVDTAQLYDNERAVGAGIDRADVDREDVTLATKVWYTDLSYDDVLETTRASLARLGVDSVDLLYVHWPADTYDADETMAAFSELADDGLIDAVGVSNFTPELLGEAIDACDVPIVANQVELHPLLQQPELREVCASHDVAVVAYAPIARGAVVDHPVLREIAADHDGTEVQVSLAWLRQNGIVAIPKATGTDHIRQNWASLGLELEPAELERIDAIDAGRRAVDPDLAAWN